MFKFIKYLSNLRRAPLGILFLLTQPAFSQEISNKPTVASPSEALKILQNRPRLETPLSGQQEASKTFQFSSVSDMNQVTDVNELRDVEPTAWAYEALRSLVERYGCIVGYPDRTFRGNRALTRWEFAAGLNACMNVMERLIQENVAVLQEDIETLKRLAEEFQQELLALGVRIDNLESRVAYLEDHQFSTVTKLTGESIVVFSGVWGQETAALGEPKGTSIDDGQITANYRNRLVFDTSFSGRDRLRVRFQTANFYFARAGSNLTDFNFSAGGNNQVRLNKLQYRFPVGDKLTVWAAGTKLTMDDMADPLAPYTSSFTTDSIAFFPALAPIYLVNDFTGPGLGAAYEFTDSLSLAMLYSAGAGFDPSEGRGLFNGQFTTGAQLTYQPSGNTGVAIAYLHDYVPQGQVTDFSLMGFTGVANSDNPFDNNATSSDHVALIWTWQLFDQFNLSGWGMYTNAYAEGGERGGDKADIWNWKVSFSFPDLLREGNLGVVSVGSPPYAARLTNRNNVPTDIVETYDTPWMIETFYVWQINDNISISPGIWVSINPENDRAPLWVGALRTSFEF